VSVHKIAFTGDQVFTATHTSGSGIYFRSTDLDDHDNLTLYGEQTSGSTAARTVLTSQSTGGKIERLSADAWNKLYLVDYGIGSNFEGIGSVFSNDGTPATGSVKITNQPSDGENIQIGLTGFLFTYTFKTNVAGSQAGQVKIGTNTSETADNLASAINDAQTGATNPIENTDYKAYSSHPYLSATSSSGTITLTDKINCKRQLAWVITPYDAADFAICPIRGGIDGTLIVAMAAGTNSASLSSTSGLSLDSEDLTTANVISGVPTFSDAVRVGGRFALSIRANTSPNGAITGIVQLSNDGINFNHDATGWTDIDTDHDQYILASDYFAEFARLKFNNYSATNAIALNIKFISQS
tara:strand:+ start:950 stop:2014 length:1065 start_codon:yes stop_codon:yes gene_type:complete